MESCIAEGKLTVGNDHIKVEVSFRHKTTTLECRVIKLHPHFCSVTLHKRVQDP